MRLGDETAGKMLKCLTPEIFGKLKLRMSITQFQFYFPNDMSDIRVLLFIHFELQSEQFKTGSLSLNYIDFILLSPCACTLLLKKEEEKERLTEILL